MFRSDVGLYGKIGLVAPVGGKTTSVSTTTGTQGNPVATLESTGTFNMGAFGAVGFALEVADGIAIFAEVQMISMHLSSTSTEMTEYKDDNGTTLENIPEFKKMINYQESLDNSSNVQGQPGFDPTKAEDQLQSSSSFGALGFNIGIALTL